MLSLDLGARIKCPSSLAGPSLSAPNTDKLSGNAGYSPVGACLAVERERIRTRGLLCNLELVKALDAGECAVQRNNSEHHLLKNSWLEVKNTTKVEPSCDLLI
jgi:hypothetical protein